MRGIKFTCPSCSQHIECDESYAGENFPCPGCATQIRVPDTASKVSLPESPDTVGSEKVLYQSAKHTETDPAEPPKPSTDHLTKPIQPTEPAVISATDKVEKAEFLCVCPVCHSQLHVRTEISSENDSAPTVAKALSQATHMKPRLELLTGESSPSAQGESRPNEDVQTIHE